MTAYRHVCPAHDLTISGDCGPCSVELMPGAEEHPGHGAIGCDLVGVFLTCPIAEIEEFMAEEVSHGHPLLG